MLVNFICVLSVSFGCIQCAGPEDIRLVNSGDACKGRVEVKYQDRWGTICETDWDLKDAEVVCRQLDCGSAVRAHRLNREFGEGLLPELLSSVKCLGDERSLFDCPHDTWGQHDCKKRRDSGVECTGSRIFDPTIYRESVSLDPNTADQGLEISADGKRIKINSSDPNYQEIYERDACVLGSSGFTSGKHYWETAITILEYSNIIPLVPMNVGVARQSVGTNEIIDAFPEHYYWTLAVRPDCLHLGLLNRGCRDGISAAKLPTKVGVYLDYDEGLISFYNADTKQHLRTFTDTLTEKVFPFVCAYTDMELELD